MKNQILRVAGVLVCGFVVIFVGLLGLQKLNAPITPPSELPLLWPDPKLVEGFSLTDQHGDQFGPDRVSGRWSLWYFGYTSCPDVCPVTLTVMNGVHDALEAHASFPEPLQSVFVSIDHARDTAERLKKYIGFFNPEFVAVRGDEEGLHRLTGQMGVSFTPQAPDELGNYVVDHSAAILLTDPHSRLIAWFAAPHTAEQISAQMIKIAQFVRDSR